MREFSFFHLFFQSITNTQYTNIQKYKIFHIFHFNKRNKSKIQNFKSQLKNIPKRQSHMYTIFVANNILFSYKERKTRCKFWEFKRFYLFWKTLLLVCVELQLYFFALLELCVKVTRIQCEPICYLLKNHTKLKLLKLLTTKFHRIFWKAKNIYKKKKKKKLFVEKFYPLYYHLFYLLYMWWCQKIILLISSWKHVENALETEIHTNELDFSPHSFFFLLEKQRE